MSIPKQNIKLVDSNLYNNLNKDIFISKSSINKE